MASVGRVTVTLPMDLVRDIDRREKDRSKFVEDAIRHELERRRREDLLRSLESPHPESLQFTDEGVEGWMRSLPNEDADLVNANSGKPVSWVLGEGWVPGSE